MPSLPHPDCQDIDDEQAERLRGLGPTARKRYTSKADRRRTVSKREYGGVPVVVGARHRDRKLFARTIPTCPPRHCPPKPQAPRFAGHQRLNGGVSAILKDIGPSRSRARHLNVFP